MKTDQGPSEAVPLAADAAPRAQLVVQGGGDAGKSIPCRRVVTLVGSRVGCKLVLRHPRVAPVHLAVVNTGTSVMGLDLVTRTGTLLNGLKMEHECLTHGDALTLRPWEFKVDLQEPSHSGDADIHPFDLEPTPRVIALEHEETGRVMQPNRELCIIGRRNGCDIVLSDKRVSRVHALLLSYFGRPAILDLLTRNRTLVNDQPVHFRMLEDGDVLAIGESRFRVRLVGSPMTDRGVNNEDAVETTLALNAEERSADLIDIHATEAAQPWRIADSLDKLARKA